MCHFYKNNQPGNSIGVILLAHGTKDPRASDPVKQYAAALAEKTNMRVEPCFQSFIEPNLSQTVKKFVEHHEYFLIVIPLFFFKSPHTMEELDLAISNEKKTYPQLLFEILDPIGFEPGIVEILSHRVMQKIENKSYE